MAEQARDHLNRLELRSVTVTLDGVTVLSDVSVGVARGRWLAVIGPNGAGKSTMMKAVAGLLRHRGEVLIDGDSAGALSTRERARRIAYAPQVPTMPAGMAVIDYVLLGRVPYLGYLARESRRDREVAAAVLDRLDLDGVMNRQLGSLSGGEQQRVVLARALAQQADILLLDEPTTALDIGHQQQALEHLDRLRRDDNLTVLTSLHDLTAAGQYADDLLLLVDGRAAAVGSAAEVLTEEVLGAHYGATVRVTAGEDGRPLVHPVRPRRT